MPSNYSLVGRKNAVNLITKNVASLTPKDFLFVSEMYAITCLVKKYTKNNYRWGFKGICVDFYNNQEDIQTGKLSQMYKYIDNTLTLYFVPVSDAIIKFSPSSNLGMVFLWNSNNKYNWTNLNPFLYIIFHIKFIWKLL